MSHFKTIIFFSTILIMVSSTTHLIAQEDFKLFNEAMELRIQREWDKALEKYESLQQNYPDSKYVDAADFWSAYIFEEQGKEPEAFKAYEQMKNKYPKSPWVDDATRHQIGLAEKFVRHGDNSYKDFLTKNLDSPNKNVKYQAALSLGKLGDQRAIPVLKEMSNNGDKDMRSFGNSLLQRFERPGQQNHPPLKPMTIQPRNSKSGKKDDGIKHAPNMENRKQRQTPATKPNIRQAPKQQPSRSTPSKKTRNPNPKKGNIR
jgi:tetratricopeptide (TPR) repeat protein